MPLTHPQLRRSGSVRSELIGYAVITLLILIGLILFLRPIATTEDKGAAPAAADTPAPKPATPARQTRVPIPGERMLEKPLPPRYALPLEQDRQQLPGFWVYRPTTEVKGDPRPGLRLRFTAQPALLACTPMKEKDAPPSRDSYAYEVIVHDGVRYLKLTDPAAPQAESMYAAYRLEGNILTMEGARPGRIVRGNLVLDPDFSPELYGTWTREAAGN